MDDNKKLVSIIVPVFNLEGYISELLDTLVNQTYETLEIIIVDDGSTDSSGAICDSYAERDERIKCIHKSNNGVSAARNQGLELSTGEYIVFVDGDDLVAPNYISKLLDSLTSNKTDMACCGYKNIFSDKTIISIPQQRVLKKEEIICALVTDTNFFTALWNKMFRRSCLMIEGNYIKFDTRIFVGEDGLWLSSVLKNVKSVSCVEEALYFWKRRTDSATKGKENGIRIDKRYLTVLSAYKMMYENIDFPDVQQLMAKRYLATTRDCAVEAYMQKKYKLSDALILKINEDIKLYSNNDLFKCKLILCKEMIKFRIPSYLINLFVKL